jgi:two-component system, sensor histidine kinase ChiS
MICPSFLTLQGIEYDDEPVDLVEIAKEVVQTARGQLGKKSIDIVLDVAEPAPPKIPGSRRRLWQVLTNLMSNGIKFTDQGEVRVKLTEPLDTVVKIEVSDTGMGIPPAEQKAIFDLFKQYGELSKRRRGTGLGLALCKQLIELHGGSIEVSSMVRKGSRFTVTLPIK